jgi:lipopolysaccharide export system permease protein
MRTIDRYVLQKTLGPLFACIAIALVAMLLERMLRLLDFMVNKGGPFYLVLKMLANLIPHYLGLAIPVAFFVGVLLAVMRLSGDSELDAIHSMGVGLRRLLLPLVGLAVVLLIATALIIGLLQPYTRYAYRALVYTVTQTLWNSSLEQGSFFQGPDDLAITVEDIGDGGRRLSGVFIHQLQEDGGTTTITAESGQIYRSRSEFRLILRLSAGDWIQSDADGAHSTVLTFERLDLPLDLALGPVKTVRPRGEVPRELTLPELWRVRDDPPNGLTHERIVAELNTRLVRITSLLFLPLLAIPLGIVSRRARRSVGVVVGIALLFFFHNVLRVGESLVEDGVLPPGLGLWLPAALFAGLAALAFHATSKRPGYNPVTAALDRANDLVDGVKRLLPGRTAPA